jgi:hypothetical protein
VNINEAALNHSEEPRKAVQAVRVDAVAVGVGEKLSTAAGALRLKSELQQHAQKNVVKILVRDSKHRPCSRLMSATQISLRERSHASTCRMAAQQAHSHL